MRLLKARCTWRWGGPFRTRSDPFPDFGPRYPEQPPSASEIGRRWQANMDRHILTGGEFLSMPPSVDVPDVRTVSGFREFLLRLLLFLRDQFVYDDIGRWPGLDWPHGRVDAYARHIVERLGLRSVASFRGLWPLVAGAPQRRDRPCPCGSGRLYERCHRRDVEALRWIRHHEKRLAIVATIEAETPCFVDGDAPSSTVHSLSRYSIRALVERSDGRFIRLCRAGRPAWTSVSSIVVVIETAVAGAGSQALITSKGELHSATGLHLACAICAVTLLVLAVAAALWVVFPRLRCRRTAELAQDGAIYFGHLRQRSPQDIHAALTAMTPDEELRQLALQLHATGEVAWRKHSWLQRSLILFGVGAALLFLAFAAF